MKLGSDMGWVLLDIQLGILLIAERLIVCFPKWGIGATVKSTTLKWPLKISCSFLGDTPF